MLAWILLTLLVLFPWVAPHVERACAKTSWGNGGDPLGDIRQVAARDYARGPAPAGMFTSGHLQRAKAEGASQPRTPIRLT